MSFVDKSLVSSCEVATKTTYIPQECPSRVGDNSIDVRYCPNSPCNGNEQSEGCNGEDESELTCCSPTNYEKLQVPCYGFVLGMITPSGCECKPCDKTEAMTQITLNGRVLDRTGRVPLRFGKVCLGGVEMAETDILGSFSISLPRGIERLVLTFTDPRFSTFHQATKVLHLRTDKTSISYTFHVPLLQKETAEVEDNTIMISHKDANIAKVGLPEDANVAHMKVYGNVVSQSIYGTTYRDIIGDSFTVDDSKLEQPVSVVILLCLTIMDETETTVNISGKYSFGFNRMYIMDFIESHEIEDVLLFELDFTSGYWTKLKEVNLGESGDGNGNCISLNLSL